MNGSSLLATVLLAVLAITSANADLIDRTYLKNECTGVEDKNILFPHESDCTLFYQCAHGEKVLKECAAGLHFNAVLQVCDWPASAGCTLDGSGDSSSSQSSSSTTDSSVSGSSTTETETIILTECPDDSESDNVHLPHESDCRLFYQCSHGKKVLKKCPPGLMYNAVLEVCDWPEFAGCIQDDSDSSVPSSTSTSSTVTTSSSTESSVASSTTESLPPSSSTIETENIVPTECPIDYEGDSIHLAHETDCTLFYQCDHGEKVLKECPEGLHFNAILQVCDWPETAGCTAGGTSDSDDSYPGSSTTGSSDSGSSTDSDSGSTEAGVTVPTECPTNFTDDNVHLAHEYNCSLFYQCVFGEQQLRECPSGLHFNAVLQVCDWPEDAGCTSRDTDDAESSGDDNNDGDSGETTPAESDESNDSGTTEDTTGSSVSGSGTSSEEDDSDGGEVPTTSDNWDVGSTEAGVTIPTECPPDSADENVHLAHESDCSLFYQCSHGNKILKECPEGLHFNALLQVCDWPESAGCAAGGTSEPDDSNADSTTTGSSDPGSSTDSSSGSTEAGVTVPTACPPNFEDANVHLAHEYNCSLFYQCVFGEEQVRECPSGLHFNAVLQVCDWPEAAGCTSRDPDDAESSGDDNNDGDLGETTPAESDESDNGEGDDNGDIGTTEDTTGSSESGSGTSSEEDDADGGEVPTTSDNWDAGSTEAGVTIPTECPPDSADENVHLTHESDCSLFYQCSHGNKILKECPEGLHFNALLQVCDWPESAGCAAGGTSEPDDSNANTSTTGSSDPGSSTDSSSGSTEAGVTVPTTCPPNFEDANVHLAHEYNCSLFYQCVFGEQQVRECPSGLHFNAVLQVCDWPEAAGCTSRDPDDAESSGDDNNGGDSGETTPAESSEWDSGEEDESGDIGTTEDTTGSSESGSGTSSEEDDADGGEIPTTSDNWDAGVTIPTECPPDSEGDNVHLAHESDCSLFYHCSHGNKISKECPEGLHFNALLQVCDWPESAGCVAGGTSGPDDSNADSSTTDSSGSGSSTDSGSGSTEAGVTVPTACPPNFEDANVHLAHEYNCSLFYQCVFGEQQVRECPSGLHFNAVLQVCDWPEAAGCTSRDPDDAESSGDDNNGGDSGETTPAESSEWDSGEEDEGGDIGTTEDTTGSSESGSGTSSEEDDADGGEVPTTSDNWDAGSTEAGVTIPTECPPDSADENVHLAHESDCSLFYQCSHGNKILMECPEGLHFNALLQVCDWPESAGCGAGGTSDPNDSNANSSTTGSSDSGSSTDSSSGSTEAGVTVPTACPPNFEDANVHLAHEYNCSLFYQCVFGEEQVRECPSGLHFNAVLQVCDWPEAAGCTSRDPDDAESSGDDNNGGDSGETTPAESDESDNGEGDDNGDIGTTEDTTGSSESGSGTSSEEDDADDGEVPTTSDNWDAGVTIPTECPPDSEGDNVHLAHESDCSLFYQCSHGNKISKECPEGLHFNALLQVCDWPESAGCATGVTSEPDDSNADSSTTSSSGSGSSTDSGSGSTEAGVTVPTACPPNFEDANVHLAHEYNCSLFYQCVFGEQQVRECPSGLHFNAVLQVCDWPEAAGCTSRDPDDAESSGDDNNGGDSGETTPAESSEWDSGEEDEGGDIGTTEDTTGSSESGSGTSSEEDDADGGEVPTTSDNWDAGSTEAGVTIPTECPPDSADENVHLAHESDCSLFYQCSHGNKILMECPEGLHFNALLQVCDWPESAGCVAGGTSDPNDSNANSSTTGSSDSGSSTDSSSGSTEAGVTVPTACPPNFEDANVHLAHEYNCSLFYQCVFGEEQVRECPSGLHFNAVLQVCDWPEAAGCTSRDPDDAESSGDDNNGGDSDETTPAESDESDNGEGDDNGDIGTTEDTTGSSESGSGTSSEEDDADGGEVPTTSDNWDAGSTEAGVTIPTECPPDSEGENVHLAHESDCSLFYQCSHGNKILMECPGGLHFNALLQVCDWPESAGCVAGGTSDPNDSNANSSTTGSSDPGSSTDSSSGSTEAGVTVPTACPPNFEDANVHLAHEYNCSLFYQCVFGEQQVKECPSGLHFNAVLQVCDWPEAAGCTSRDPDDAESSGDDNNDGDLGETTPAESSEWDSSEWDNSGDIDTTDESGSVTGSTTESSLENSTETESAIIIIDRENCEHTESCPTEDPLEYSVLLAHTSCTKFCKCSNGVPYVYDCPQGLYFNDELKVCDWSESSECIQN